MHLSLLRGWRCKAKLSAEARLGAGQVEPVGLGCSVGIKRTAASPSGETRLLDALGVAYFCGVAETHYFSGVALDVGVRRSMPPPLKRFYEISKIDVRLSNAVVARPGLRPFAHREQLIRHRRGAGPAAHFVVLFQRRVFSRLSDVVVGMQNHLYASRPLRRQAHESGPCQKPPGIGGRGLAGERSGRPELQRWW